MSATTMTSHLREAAQKIWDASGFPTHREEEYKYTGLAHLGETAWQLASVSAVEGNFGLAADGGFDAYRFVFVNGIFNAELSNALTEDFPFKFETLTTESAGVGELASVSNATFEVAAHLGKLNKPQIPATAAWNTLHFTSGAAIRVGKSVVVDKPIEIVHVSTGENTASAPRILIDIATGGELTLIETYVSADESTSLTNAVTEINIAQNAGLKHYRIGDSNLNSTHLGLVEVKQASDSRYDSINLVFGSKLTRNDINLFVDGSGTHTRFDGVVAIGGDQHVDNHTRLDHAKPHCESFEAYKHLLMDKSTAVFNGKIFVHQDAQKTDAKQTNMTLLLSPTATINTKPQLEIFADDVKCTHGATVGQLREDAMFYLRSRGVPTDEARAMLVYAFAAEVFELIGHEGIREALGKRLFAKLGMK